MSMCIGTAWCGTDRSVQSTRCRPLSTKNVFMSLRLWYLFQDNNSAARNTHAWLYTMHSMMTTSVFDIVTCGGVQRGHSLFCLKVRFESDASQLEDWMFRFLHPCSLFSNSVSSPVCLLSGVLLLNCHVDSEPRAKIPKHQSETCRVKISLVCSIHC